MNSEVQIQAITADGKPLAIFSNGEIIEVTNLSATHPMLNNLSAHDIWQLALAYAGQICHGIA